MTGSDGAAGAHDAFSAQEQMLLRELERAEAGAALASTSADEGMEEHLLFWLGETLCLAPLALLREVLPGAPPHVALPFSPTWLWGIFPLRTDLVALVDPAPLLLHGPQAARRMTEGESSRVAGRSGANQIEPQRALVVGEGEQVIALVADHLGAICALRQEDREPYTPDTTPGAPSPQQKYVAGVYHLPNQSQPALALQIKRLCDDIFAAIEERPADE
jgi:chemotaxis signal transduction protein